MSRALRRSDFGDAESFARAMYVRGGPASLNEISSFVGLHGPYGAVLSAVWGHAAERDRELESEVRLEAAARPHVLVEKLPHRRRTTPKQATRTLLDVTMVGCALSAAEFAYLRGWIMDVSVTLSFVLMGAIGSSQSEALSRRFLKCLTEYCRNAGLPRAFIAVIECAPTIGLHMHLAMHMPADMRLAFRGWLKQWVESECWRRGVAYDPSAWTVNRHRAENRHLHFAIVHYALKGCDVEAEVQSAALSPDGRVVRLGDLLAFEYCDPGEVDFERLYIGSSLSARARTGWKSAWERGERDVCYLYPREFLDHVRRRYPVAMLDGTETKRIRQAAAKLCDWSVRSKPLGDALCDVEMGWHTVVERNVEIVTRQLMHLCRVSELAPKMIAPADRVVARGLLREVVSATHGIVNENAIQIAAFVDEMELLSGRACLRNMAFAEEVVRELGGLLGIDSVQPAWALIADLDSLNG